MSNRSRARFRADVDETPDVDPEEQARIDEANAALEDPDKGRGLSKLVDVVMRSRDTGKTPPVELVTGAKVVDDARAKRDADTAPRPDPIRQPTAFEAAILSALGGKLSVVGGRHGRPPMHVPTSIASGGMYGGTVEPERVARRRRRNKAARAARSGNRRRTFGRVYRSRFGYPVTVPGITPGVDIDGNVEAEVVDA